MMVSGGVVGFTDALHRSGARPREVNGLVLYIVEPVDGRWAGERVETAVATDELPRWPVVPPHWLHFPADVTFPATNSRPSPIAGWIQHSRQIAGWGRDADPAAGWLAHVRSVLGEAR